MLASLKQSQSITKLRCFQAQVHALLSYSLSRYSVKIDSGPKCLFATGESANIVGARFLWGSLLVAGRGSQPFYAEYWTDTSKTDATLPGSQTQARAPKKTSARDVIASSSSSLSGQGPAKDADLAPETEDMVRAMARKILGDPTSSDDALLIAGMDSLGKTHIPVRIQQMVTRLCNVTTCNLMMAFQHLQRVYPLHV